eukprot:1141305-Pelagomonas_calceolata.AAC.7
MEPAQTLCNKLSHPHMPAPLPQLAHTRVLITCRNQMYCHARNRSYLDHCTKWTQFCNRKPTQVKRPRALRKGPLTSKLARVSPITPDALTLGGLIAMLDILSESLSIQAVYLTHSLLASAEQHFNAFITPIAQKNKPTPLYLALELDCDAKEMPRLCWTAGP